MIPNLLTDPTWQELWETPIGEWFTVVANNQTVRYQHIRGKNCIISIEEEPTNFNRGPFHAKIEYKGLNIEPADGWEHGRYYFTPVTAMREVEAWLRAWNQLEEGDRVTG